jgi:mono/diheme cytochrome c family protein
MRNSLKSVLRGSGNATFVLLLINCLFMQSRVGLTAEFEASKEFRQYCGSCHGNTGDGQGVAARYLYPKPRDLLNGKIRLATSSNMIASGDDIKAILLNGVPNTSMPSWKQLSAGLIDRLVTEVQQLQVLGAQQRVSAVLKEDGLLVDSDGNLNSEGQQEVTDYTTQHTVPTAAWISPPILRSSATVLEDGRKLYLKQNCHKCHGAQGEGSFGVDLVDDKGFPTFARDLSRDPYKAGSDFETIARVIRLGLPGTMMPSSGALSDDELGRITVYVQSLAKAPPRQMGNIQRYHRAIGFRR